MSTAPPLQLLQLPLALLRPTRMSMLALDLNVFVGRVLPLQTVSNCIACSSMIVALSWATSASEKLTRLTPGAEVSISTSLRRSGPGVKSGFTSRFDRFLFKYHSPTHHLLLHETSQGCTMTLQYLASLFHIWQEGHDLTVIVHTW